MLGDRDGEGVRETDCKEEKAREKECRKLKESEQEKG